MFNVYPCCEITVPVWPRYFTSNYCLLQNNTYSSKEIVVRSEGSQLDC